LLKNFLLSVSCYSFQGHINELSFASFAFWHLVYLLWYSIFVWKLKYYFIYIRCLFDTYLHVHCFYYLQLCNILGALNRLFKHYLPHCFTCLLISEENMSRVLSGPPNMPPGPPYMPRRPFKTSRRVNPHTSLVQHSTHRLSTNIHPRSIKAIIKMCYCCNPSLTGLDNQILSSTAALSFCMPQSHLLK
jgi:hypothetical protein